MRIAYVSLHWPRTRSNGVGKKIHAQLEAWRTLGHHACLFMHTETYQPETDLIDGEHFFFETAGRINTELSRIAAVRRMIRAVQAYHPDLIYLRYGVYVYPVHVLADIAPVVEEINTNDITQHDGLGRLYSLYNRLTRGILLRRVRGLVTVSHELAATPAFSSFKKPTCVIANGINLNEFAALPSSSNKIPRLVFIGNPGYSWHGVDKLIELARLVSEIEIDIVGYHELPEFEPLPANITLHGYLDLQDYQSVLQGADVAVSSLAVHRVQLEEASPLKSRECLAFGLPLVVAYTDTDLNDMQNDFLLKIPNKPDNIRTHASVIRDFAYRMRGIRVPKGLITSIDLMNKETSRIAFFEEIVSTHRGSWSR